jgi:import inner membrane translocase subunit TIM50
MLQPENTLKLKPWTSDASDTTLLDLIPFLQMVATRGVKDVREVVKSYDGVEDVAKAFRLRMQAAVAPKQGTKASRFFS